jgi:hypothetical protein
MKAKLTALEKRPEIDEFREKETVIKEKQVEVYIDRP